MPDTRPTPLAPIARRSLVDEVVDALAGPILRDELAAGESLPAERQLAEQLGVRRGTLREGIQRLQQAGLIEVRQGGGTTVRDWRRSAGLEVLPSLLRGGDGAADASVLLSVLEMRSALAPDVARQAARRHDAEAAGRLRATLDALSLGDGDPAGRAASAAELWNTLVDASDNIAYRLAYNALLAVAELGGAWVGDVLSNERDRLDVYAELVDAVLARDTERAGDAARRITAVGERAFEDALQPEAADQTGPAQRSSASSQEPPT